jgi:leucyl-tRNA synthetase
MTRSPSQSGVDAPETYDPSAVEARWQARWRERGTNRTDVAQGRNPFYALMMFPYPSAEGLHVGNLFAFTGNDIYGRFQRLQGHTVFQPIGFDAFGIHSENFALKVGEHPMRLIPRNVANFTRQLQRAGLMIDWRYTVDTTDPEYYRWTQWIFVQLFRKGLAYRKKAAVNWCPSCKTVLANEQVIGGACERCGTPVEQRFLAQWFFRISDYAQRLLENLDGLDWSDTTRTAQRNWIGKSEGAEPATGMLSGRQLLNLYRLYRHLCVYERRAEVSRPTIDSYASLECVMNGGPSTSSRSGGKLLQIQSPGKSPSSISKNHDRYQFG